jgi:NAD(P)-dependent dehydrogenase (short-subunit alcohol dehydrogenase family)
MVPLPDYGVQTYRGSGKLEGQKALITGGDSGIGRATALAFAREGADVMIAYLEEDDDARQTASLVTDAGRVAITVRGDIGDDNHARRLITRAQSDLGGLDILVNNAAQQSTHEELGEFSREELELTFKTNFFAMFRLSQFAAEIMRPGSVIINTASVQAYKPSPSLLAYAATKGAVVNFTKALAAHVAEKGIRVNAVAPGPVWTPLIPSTMQQDDIKKFGSDTLLRRPAQPAELAPIYVLLASREASYITGMVYGATGGTAID